MKKNYFLIAAVFLFLIPALCPFSLYKSVGDSLASDGDLERLTADLVTVIRAASAICALLFAGLLIWHIKAPGSFDQFFLSLLRLPRRCLQDAGPFFHDLGKAFSPRGSNFRLFLPVFIAEIVLRAVQLSAPLMHDEAYSMAIWGRSDLLFAVSDYHLPNNHVFHSVLVNLIYHHIGKTVPLLRLPVFLSGCLLIPAVWLLGRLFYNEFTALLAAGLTAFGPFLVFYSVNARGYEIQALLSVLTVGLAVYAARKCNIFAWVLLILLSALNFFTLPIALYPFGGICVWLLLNVIFFDGNHTVWRSRWQLFKYLIFMGVCVSIISMLLYVPLLRYSGWNSFFGNIYIGGVEGSAFGATMISRLKDNVQAFTETLPVPVICFLAAGLVLSLFMFRRTSKEKISYGAALFLWMALVIPFQKPNLWPRTLLFLHPFLLLFVSSGLYCLKLLPAVGRASGWIAALIVIAAGVSQFWAARDIPGTVGPNEQAVRVILDREEENAGNIHFVTAAQDNAPLWIYADAYGLPRKIFDKREPFNMVYAFVNPLNDAYLGPKTLDDLLDRFGPGSNFMVMEDPEILMNEPYGILYRFPVHESAVRKAYGEFPDVQNR